MRQWEDNSRVATKECDSGKIILESQGENRGHKQVTATSYLEMSRLGLMIYSVSIEQDSRWKGPCNMVVYGGR